MESLGFHPLVAAWFGTTFGTPTQPQKQGWPAIRSGRDALIAAPTGSGKTLAAFMASLDDLFREALSGALEDETRVLYVTPLKALSNDIHRNLSLPLQGLSKLFSAAAADQEKGASERDWSRCGPRVGLRTGDTSSYDRRKITQRPPHILVTTPESFYLLLTSASGRRTLRTVRTVIIDEIHALAGNRRGAHLSLSLERLDHLAGRKVQRIGLSATQRPLAEVARFLVGQGRIEERGEAAIHVVGSDRIEWGSGRVLDLSLEVPRSPIEAVMSAEVWEETYDRLAQIVEEHRTTLLFVNTRRMCERVAHHLATRLGSEVVASHHGSLSTKIRHRAENRLKNGQLRVLVATASLELGIDIGEVDIVCQLGSTHSISRLVQRIGRSGHVKTGTPKGRLFPLSRDDLIECIALCRCLRQGELDRLQVESAPVDVLAQQIVAAAANDDWEVGEIYRVFRRAYPYRQLTDEDFDGLIRMLADGFTTRRGRRGAYLHFDEINGRIRGRRGARITALTSGGAIPENADYRVEVEPEGTFIGTINEDFAIESIPGDVFQLGSTSWRLLRVENGVVRVADAEGQPPSIPFWLGEAPARSDELSTALSELHRAADRLMNQGGISDVREMLRAEPALSEAAALQAADYLGAIHSALGVIPSHKTLVVERFFDEAGGMQLVLHSTYGGRINRAFGLALRKRFCRSFNFELQAAANENALVLSLGETHSFELESVFRFLSARTVKDVLTQALLDAPMFQTRWRWNTNRSLAIPRRRGGKRVPANIQRMEAEDLIALVFPDSLACQENLSGSREVPDHPLVRQTISDCLREAMDIDGFTKVLEGIESQTLRCLAIDLPEPSPAAHEILNSRPYTFLDDAPLEERRTRAVAIRKRLSMEEVRDIGALDPMAVERVRSEAWPRVHSAEEVHDALLCAGVIAESELGEDRERWLNWLEELSHVGRAAMIELRSGYKKFWFAAERSPLVQSIYPEVETKPQINVPERLAVEWDSADAIREIIRGRMNICGPTCAAELADLLALSVVATKQALLVLEAEGFILRGTFTKNTDIPEKIEWCERRLAARIHRLTINRLRREIEAVSAASFYRFLLRWQYVEPSYRVDGSRGLEAVIAQLDGYEVGALSWEADILPARLKHYDSAWLDALCLSGQVTWGRLSARQRRPIAERDEMVRFSAGPLRSSPMALIQRSHLRAWLTLGGVLDEMTFSSSARVVLDVLIVRGALFFDEVKALTRLLTSQVEDGLGELVAGGFLTCDSFAGLRSLLKPARHRRRRSRYPRSASATWRPADSLERAGRWSLFPREDRALREQRELDLDGLSSSPASDDLADNPVADFAWALLRRYGIVFRRLIDRERLAPPWRDLARIYRRLEARGEIRGGYFIKGFSGEHFALPEALEMLRQMSASRRGQPSCVDSDEPLILSAADPLNLTGILTPTRRIAANTKNRLVFRDGLPVAAIEAGQVHSFPEALV